MNIAIRNPKVLTLTILAVAAVGSNFARCDELGQASLAAIEKASPSIVRIRVIGGSGGDELEVSSQVTTGIVISKDGDILTSVFGFGGQPAAIFVEDSNGDRVAASIVATDHLRKVVLLKCDEGVFVPATMAKKRWPDVGEYTVAAGRLYPGRLPAVSVGIISANQRIHGIAIQTDAKISPVNYGGPLLDLNGIVQGLLVPLSPRDSGEGINAGVEWYDSGIGFAIPAVDVLEVAESLKTGKDRTRGTLGISPSTQNPLAPSFTIASVHPSSPAAQAGIKVGDKISEVNKVEITRFGLFDSVIKSSYAGDSLSLTISRNGKEVKADVQLVAQLPPVLQAYLGLIVIDNDDSEPGNGISVVALPNSPLSKAGVTGRFLLQEMNGEKIDSAKTLRKQLRSIIAGQEVKVSYKETADAEQNKTATVVLEKASTTLLTLDDTLVRDVCGSTEETQWKRFEKEVPGGSGKVWSFAPVSKDVKTGIVVLLSETQTAREVIAKRWGQVCQQHNLMLIVPTSSEGRELGREDIEFIEMAVRTAAADRSPDTQRIVLVAQKAQSELCGELLLKPQPNPFRTAAFVESWPRLAGVPVSAIAERRLSVLILNGIIQSRTARALRTQSIKHVSEAGTSVIESDVFDETSAESAIANWALGLKAL